MQRYYAALKQVDIASEDDLEEYSVEIDILHQCKHKNVVGIFESYLAQDKLWVGNLFYCFFLWMGTSFGDVFQLCFSCSIFFNIHSKSNESKARNVIKYVPIIFMVFSGLSLLWLPHVAFYIFYGALVFNVGHFSCFRQLFILFSLIIFAYQGFLIVSFHTTELEFIFIFFKYFMLIDLFFKKTKFY